MKQPYPLAFNGPLKPGSQSDTVWLLQAMLCAIGRHYINIHPPKPSGQYDESTRQSIMRIQRACGLTPDGVTDEKTWEAITLMFSRGQSFT